ncbi:hypothetical protein Vc3S01_A0638 [Vibrio campbellii]|uniref:helix-turn-helix domain-containing protein n=1 Tax=Vibrio campbellii TaxID=680 RepID=UPI000A2FF802|nr:helix-turn-helix domain-containing protein [Vibrio campbellii]ARR08611.1 hypothetical protein Vc3S01_A0638 [Vibrio campbellii]
MNIELSEVLDRISKLEQVKTDADIAQILNVSPQTMSTWKRRGTIPYERICELCNAKGYSLDSILLGRKAEKTEIESGLIVEVIGAIRSKESELREIKLDLLTEELVAMYNSVAGVSSKVQREKILKSYISITNRRVISNADEQLLRFIEQSAPFFEDNPEMIDNMPERVRSQAKLLLEDIAKRRAMLKIISNDQDDDEVPA